MKLNRWLTSLKTRLHSPRTRRRRLRRRQTGSDVGFVMSRLTQPLEDRVLLAADLGDAPDTGSGTGVGNYETLLASGGPSHTIDATQTTLFLGASVDADDGTLQNPTANADDVDGALPDDEDGVLSPFTDLVGTIGAAPTVTLLATNTTGSAATLSGWIDYNNDGVFNNATERAQIAVPDNSTGHRVTLIFPVIPDGFTGETFSRFRLSTDVAAHNSTGAATGGEVEDYAFDITQPVVLPVSVRSLFKIEDGVPGGLTQGSLGSGFGTSVADLGDLDGDGVTDIAVGGSGGSDDGRGAVFVLHMNSDGTVKSQLKISDGTGGLASGTLSHSDIFGSSVAGLGDLDGDGVPDMVVGAEQDGSVNSGAVYVLLMNTDGTVKSQTKFTVGTSSRLFGSSVASLGDLDSDGVADIIVGARNEGGTGAVHVLRMNSNGTVKSRTKISNGAGGLAANTLDIPDRFGSSVANLGDLDGDGVVDIAVGAQFDGNGDIGEGAVYVLLMNSNGTVKSQAKISDGTTGGLTAGSLGSGATFGRSVSALGDLDGDGVTDMAVGATGGDGAVFVLLMNTDGTVKSQTTISDVANRVSFGSGVAGLGDLNGDGAADMVVGAERFGKGAVYVLNLTPPLPEIDVQGNTDFGGAMISGGMVARTFTIENTGELDLNLTGSPDRVSISGDHAADFSVTMDPASLVTPADTTTFQITFDPSAAGVRTATISIDSNDPDEPTHDFVVRGTGVVPATVDIVGGDLVVQPGGALIDDWTFAVSGGSLTITDDNGNLFDLLDELNNGAGDGTSSVSIPMGTNAWSGNLVIDTLDGNDSLMFDSSFAIGASRGVIVDGGADADTVNWDAGTDPLASLNLSAETINVGASEINTGPGNQTYNGNVVFGAETTLTGADVTFGGSVDVSILGPGGPLIAFIQDDGSGTVFNNGSNFGGTVGVEFTVGARDIVVKRLGLWDGPNPGGAEGDGLEETAEVGLWDDGGTLLGQVTVPQGTPGELVGPSTASSAFAALGSPVTLAANQKYRVGALYTNGGNAFRGGTGHAFDTTLVTRNGFPISTSSSLAFPTQFGAAFLSATFEYGLPGAGVSTGEITINASGRLQFPSSGAPGTLPITGDLKLGDNSTLPIEIGGTTAGTGAGNHDQINATGAVNLGTGVSLDVSAFDAGGGNFEASVGDAFTIIKRTGGTGTFDGLAEGATISDFLGPGGEATISYTGGDGDDVVLTATVVPNMVPAISVGNLNYTEGQNSGNPVVIDAGATADDDDGDADWDGGSLVVQITGNAEAGDEVSIGNVGSITVVGSDVRHGGVSIGTIVESSGTADDGIVTGGDALTVDLNSGASNASLQDLVRAIRYRTTSETPGANDRTVTFTATDTRSGMGTDTSTVTVASVADDPVVTAPSAATTVNAANVSIDGTAEANALVQVYSDANNNGMIDGADAVVASQQLSGGATAFSISTPLTPDTANNFLVTATDASTDESDPVDVLTVTEDSTGPTPVITATQSSPTADDPINVTIDFGEVVTGFALGDVTVGNGTAGNLNTADNRTFTVDVSPTADGAVTIDVAAGVAQEALGNDNQAAVQFSITSDRTAPTVTVDPTTTTDTTPELTGTVGDSGATVKVSVDGTTHMAVNNGDGTWTLADDTVTALTAGVHNVVVTATDAAGNVGSDSTANELAIAVFAFDFGAVGSPVEAGFTQVLTSTVIPGSPSAGDFGWTSSTGLSDRDRTNVTSDRDRDYHKSGGSKTFQAVLPNGEYNVSFTIGSGADPRNNVGVLIEGTQVATVNTTPGQFATQTHLVMITDGLLDLELQKQGSTAVGLNALTILPATNEPRLDAVDASGFHRLGDPATAIDPALTLTDPDDASLTGAEVRVISGFVAGEDVLGFTNQNGITGSFNAGTGVLTLTGTASVADYRTALRSVTFDSTGTTSGSRGIQFAASDGTTGTGYDTRSLTVIPSGGASLDFDFNDTGSPTEAGFIPITVSSLFVGGPGFGWLNDAVTNGLAARDRGAPNDLNRDYHKIGSGTMTFAVNLPNSVYDVTITIGSNVDPRNSVGVFLENTQVDTVSTTSSQFSTMTHRVTVSDGRLEVKLQRQGSTGVGINALRVAEVTGAPSVSLANGAAVFVSGGGAIPVDGSLTVADIDSTNLTGATVSIIGGLNAAADSLSFTDQLGITGSYVGSTGILTLTGTATVADYQTALRSVQFNSTDNTGIRTVQVDVNDGSETGSDTRDIIVSAPFSGSVSYDFGTQTSDVEAGFIGVDETSAFNVALGYGWLSTTGLSSRNRNAPIPLDQRRDYVRIGSGSMTFAVNLPNGDYDVQLTMGSSENSRHNVGVIMEGTQVDTISTAVNQFATPTHRVTVSDNRLEVELARQGASAASINALVITEVGP